jgi:hypothetical protein
VATRFGRYDAEIEADRTKFLGRPDLKTDDDRATVLGNTDTREAFDAYIAARKCGAKRSWKPPRSVKRSC